MTQLDDDLLALLRRVDTPTVCNAIEVVQGQRGFDAFTRGTVLCSDPVAGAVVVLALVLERSIGGRRPRGWSGRLRLLAIALGMAILAGRLAALAPEMRADLHAYWEAAEAGQWISAEDYRARFQALHPLASRLLTANLACLLVAVACSPAAQRRADRGDDP